MPAVTCLPMARPRPFPSPTSSSCWTGFQGCHLCGAQALCTKGARDDLHGSCLSSHLLQPAVVARHSRVTVWAGTWLFSPYFYLWTDYKTVVVSMHHTMWLFRAWAPSIWWACGMGWWVCSFAGFDPFSSGYKHQTFLIFCIFILYFYN